MKNLRHYIDVIKQEYKNRKVKYEMDNQNLIPKKRLEYFCIHLVGECNLKCKGCDHFAPLAKGEYLSLEIFERDFKRLSEITNANVGKISLMGGEPLLHPNLTDFFPIARKYFPNSTIQLVTNGILLLSQTDEFWIKAKESSINIMNTKYPLKLNYEKMFETAEKFGVTFEHYNYKSKEKKSYKIPLDLQGKQNKKKNFIKCFHANRLCFLSNGKIYTCTVAPNVYRFNEAFNCNIPISNKNGIDIFKVKNEKQLLKFLAKPIPMCKYCAVKNRLFDLKWELSKKDISEWTVTE